MGAGASVKEPVIPGAGAKVADGVSTGMEEEVVDEIVDINELDEVVDEVTATREEADFDASVWDTDEVGIVNTCVIVIGPVRVPVNSWTTAACVSRLRMARS